MRQARHVSPGETVTFTESLPTRAGVLDDISGAELRAVVAAPDGNETTFSAIGLATGEMTFSGTIANQTGTHKAYLWVNGEMRKQLDMIARGPSAVAGTASLPITFDRTVFTWDQA